MKTRKEMVRRMFAPGELLAAVNSIFTEIRGEAAPEIVVEEDGALELFTRAYAVFSDEEFQAFYDHIMSPGGKESPPEKGTLLWLAVERHKNHFVTFFHQERELLCECLGLLAV